MHEVSIEEQAFNAENRSFGDDRLGVLFYLKVVEDPDRTLAEGRKCFTEREYVKIMVPGDRTNIVDRSVRERDRERFPKQYERFKTQQAQPAHEGTPLTLWPQMPAVLAEELKYINIFTVEQLADLADTYVNKVPMGNEWKRKAAQFVSALRDQVQVNKLQAALDQRDVEIESLKQAIADQAARIDQLSKRK